jgi:hypothetical protein
MPDVIEASNQTWSKPEEDTEPRPTAWLILEAWLGFLYIDLIGSLGFRVLQRVVSRTPRRAIEPSPHTIALVQRAFLVAAALYVRRARCLKRAAVVTRLLRRRGVDAKLVIGYHLPPLDAHAWVEVADKIVSEYQPGLEHYRVLDRW